MIGKLFSHFFGSDPTPDDVLTRLKRYKSYSGRLIGFGFFGAIVFIKLGVSSYPSISDFEIIDLFTMEAFNKWDALRVDLYAIGSDKWRDLLFYMFIWIWYWQYDASASREIEILSGLYSDDRAPPDWGKITGGRLVPFLSVGITVTFIMILIVSDNLLLLSALVLLLLCQDAVGNNMLRRNILGHFYDPLLMPNEADPLREVILERRKVALDYWVWRPHLARIGFMMCATSIISALSIAKSIGGYPLSDPFFRLLFVAVIICNEGLIATWRIARDESFKDLNSKLLVVRTKLTTEGPSKQA